MRLTLPGNIVFCWHEKLEEFEGQGNVNRNEAKRFVRLQCGLQLRSRDWP
jgi:hypothetical protein